MGRTKKNIKLKIPEKPRKIKGSHLGGYRTATTISSAAPSTSRTTLRVYISIRFFFAQISVKNFLERKAGENTEKYSIFNFENPYIWGISGGRNDQVSVKFRVMSVMTTSIRLRV